MSGDHTGVLEFRSADQKLGIFGRVHKIIELASATASAHANHPDAGIIF
jgi:hypothetical protein